MAGNSKRGGAVRKEGSKKGPQVGSGGKGQARPGGQGPNAEGGGSAASRRPRARPAVRAGGRQGSRAGAPRRGKKVPGGPEVVAGRNSVLEALRAGVRAESLHLFSRIDADDRVSELLHLALEADVPVVEVSKARLDLLTGAAAHQGVALVVEPFRYLGLHDLLAAPGTPLIVALDGIQDPRNLGAIIRSAAAFGATGVLLPERRAAGVTVAAWKTSAGAVARMPIARVTNLARALEELKAERVFTVGLAADGDVALAESELLVEPLALVIGSEGKGLSRLARDACDQVARIPIAARDGVAQRLRGRVARALRGQEGSLGESGPEGVPRLGAARFVVFRTTGARVSGVGVAIVVVVLAPRAGVVALKLRDLARLAPPPSGGAARPSSPRSSRRTSREGGRPRTAFSSGRSGQDVLDVRRDGDGHGDVVAGGLGEEPAVVEHLVEDLGRLELGAEAPWARREPSARTRS